MIVFLDLEVDQVEYLHRLKKDQKYVMCNLFAMNFKLLTIFDSLSKD